MRTTTVYSREVIEEGVPLDRRPPLEAYGSGSKHTRRVEERSSRSPIGAGRTYHETVTGSRHSPQAEYSPSKSRTYVVGYGYPLETDKRYDNEIIDRSTRRTTTTVHGTEGSPQVRRYEGTYSKSPVRVQPDAQEDYRSRERVLRDEKLQTSPYRHTRATERASPSGRVYESRVETSHRFDPRPLHEADIEDEIANVKRRIEEIKRDTQQRLDLPPVSSFVHASPARGYERTFEDGRLVERSVRYGTPGGSLQSSAGKSPVKRVIETIYYD